MMLRGCSLSRRPPMRTIVLVLFAALVGFTSYWAVFDSNTLKDETANRRPLI